MHGLRPGKATLGLDIGSGAVKAVELSRGAIRSCGFSLRSPGENRPDDPAIRAIREALEQAAPRAKRAVVGLDGADILLHRFTLPPDLPPAERDEQARIKASQAAPFDLAEAAFDYVPEGAGGHSQNYRLAIARSDTVEKLCRTVRQAGIDVAAVDVTPVAVGDAVAATVGGEAPLAVLDGGQRQLRLSVHLGGETLFRHSQPFGCSILAARLSRACGLSQANPAIADHAPAGGAAGRIRESFLADLGRHAARSLQLYLTSGNDAAPPERIALHGGAALLKGACGAIQDELDLPVERIRPAAQFTAGEPECSPALFGAYALALNDHS